MKLQEIIIINNILKIYILSVRGQIEAGVPSKNRKSACLACPIKVKVKSCVGSISPLRAFLSASSLALASSSGVYFFFSISTVCPSPLCDNTNTSATPPIDLVTVTNKLVSWYHIYSVDKVPFHGGVSLRLLNT